MKRRESKPFSALGASSLLAIFGILALTVLAMLTLNTALYQDRLLEASLESSSRYYAADLEAERIFALLRSGEQVPGVTEQEGIYRYSCPISGQQTLYVEIMEQEGVWTVLRWQAVAQQPDASQDLPVWAGLTEEESG